MKYGVEGAEMR